MIDRCGGPRSLLAELTDLGWENFLLAQGYGERILGLSDGKCSGMKIGERSIRVCACLQSSKSATPGLTDFWM